MTLLAKRPDFARKLRRPTAAQLLYTMLALVLLLQVELVFSKSVNWDEFFHFSQIHQHLLGRPAPWLQAPFVALFFWVPALPGDNIDHIQLIRLLILPFEIATIAAIMAMATRFTDRATGLLCGLIYATGGYVFLHAFALRADMIAAALLMGALWLSLCRPLSGRNIALIFLLVGMAFVSTIKAVLYAPAFLGVLLFRLEKPWHRRALVAGTILAALAGVSLLWLTPHLPAAGPAGILRDIGDLGRASIDRMFSGGIFPQGSWLILQIVFAPLLSVAILATLVHACWPGGRARTERVLLLSLLAPLATVTVYRNAFPYHFAFILPPAAVAIAPVVDWLRRRYGLVAVALLPLASALMLSLGQDRDVLPRQRAILTGIAAIFPTPVTYIDNSGMAGNFPRAVNHFASGWGLENYYRSGKPIYSQALKTEPVPMLLVNNVVLQDIFHDIFFEGRLLAEDDAILRDNYIPHWGSVFVAGKVIAAGERPLAVEIAIPGRYTVEGGSIGLDGRYYAAGSVVTLARGTHSVAAGRAAAVTLRWGEHLGRPDFAWPRSSIFTAY